MGDAGNGTCRLAHAIWGPCTRRPRPKPTPHRFNLRGASMARPWPCPPGIRSSLVCLGQADVFPQACAPCRDAWHGRAHRSRVGHPGTDRLPGREYDRRRARCGKAAIAALPPRRLGGIASSHCKRVRSHEPDRSYPLVPEIPFTRNPPASGRQRWPRRIGGAYGIQTRR